MANLGSNNLTKLRASDGANLGVFGAGNGPAALAFDGINIWCANMFGGTLTRH